MIPLHHIITSLDSLVCIFIAIKVFGSYRKTRDKNLKYFLLVFFALGIFFGLASLPSLVINDPQIVQIIYVLFYIPISISSFSLFLICFRIFGNKLAYIGMVLNVILAIGIFALNILNFTPASIKRFGLFYYWAEGTPSWLSVLFGAFLGLLLIFNSTLYLTGGLKSKELVATARAIRMTAGFLVFLIAASFYFVFAPITTNIFYKVISVILGGTISLFALTLFVSAIYYKPKIKNNPQ